MGSGSVQRSGWRRLGSLFVGGVTVAALALGATPAVADDAATGVLSGVVSAPSGAIHPRGSVIAYEVDTAGESHDGGRTADVGVDGRFAFHALPAGDYKVFVHADARGVLDEYWPDAVTERDAAIVTVPAGGAAAELQVRLDAAAVLSGVLTDYAGDPFPGARATLYRLVNGEPDRTPGRTVVADAQGRYEFDDVVEGSYRVIYGPPYDPTRRATPSETDETLQIGRGEVRPGLNKRVWYVTDIRGIVTDARGIPDAEAEVVLHYRGGESVSTTANGRGIYSFHYLHPGEATLAFRSYGTSEWTWLGGAPSVSSARWIAVDEDTIDASQQLRPRTFTGLRAGVSGLPYVGNTLLGGADGGNYETTRAIQWLADGIPIPGATGDEFRLTAAYRAKRISVRVTWSEPGYTTVVRTSSPTSPVAAGTLLAPRPSISGTAKVGGTLTAKTGTWTKGTTLGYQWYASGKAIKGATKSTYKLPASLVGKKVTVKVTGKKAGYVTAAKTSKATPKVTQSATPTIKGTAKVGQKLTANPGKWGSGMKLTYQWYANGKAIAKAKGKTLTLTSGVTGKKITVKVTGKKSGYATVTTTSKATAAVKAKTVASAVAKPVNKTSCPKSHPIKGNQTTRHTTDWIYHVLGGQFYEATHPEQCFATEAAAKKAGYRASKR